MITITPHDLAQVQDRASLFAFLNTALGWPVSAEDTFTYDESLLQGGETSTVQVSRLLPFGADDKFLILLAEWQTPLRRVELREILQKVRARIRSAGAYGSRALTEIVFVCPAQEYGAVWFAHFEAQEGRQPRLQVFGWEQNRAEATRTLREINLPALALPARDLYDNLDWEEGYKRWLSAWDVEAVTRSFFKDYREVFGGVRDSLPEEFAGDQTLWTQRLFNRLLFIHFLSQKKEGWLRFGGRRDYLHALWEGRDRTANFYSAHLRPLFFTALNNRHASTLKSTDSVLHSRIGDVPYLNGGLFEKAPEDDAILALPDAALERVLALFGRYRFTITESTPDDVEVAVDPEMLGKVFEELVTGRHESGSYYTPRPVVAFMCREALKGYLGGHAALVDGRSADTLNRKEAAALLHKLAAVRVVDPACGSGAYLLGMLHELYALTGLLELRADPLSARAQYQRKLAIIQNALYGVDLDPFAVNVARLRLWLSLAVEHTGAQPEPLPNLDFKVEAGDSLAVPLPQRDLTGDIFRQAQLDEYKAVKQDYGSPYCTGDRTQLRERIADLKRELAAWTHPSGSPELGRGGLVPGFDWQVEFAEVFSSPSASDPPLTGEGGEERAGRGGGFDIVLANPPYVRQELIKAQKPALAKAFPEVYTGTADLYCYFYARAVQLLAPGGMLAFISPNKWFRAGYGAGLRKYLADTCRVHSITDFGELPVFQAAATFPMIFVAMRTRATSHEPRATSHEPRATSHEPRATSHEPRATSHEPRATSHEPRATSHEPRATSHEPRAVLYTQVKSLNVPYPDVLALQTRDGQSLPPAAIQGADWTLTDAATATRLRTMELAGVPLGEYVKGQIFRGVLTGFNAAFVIDGKKRAELIADDPESAEIIKPLAVGDDVRRWHIRAKDKWLIVTKIGVDVDRYPAIFQHLKQWQPELEKRLDQGNHWWELRACAYYEKFDTPKIVFPDIAKEPRFAYDNAGTFLGNTAYIIPSSDLHLLGILNSSTVWEFAQARFSCLGDPAKGGRFRFIYQSLVTIPIPTVTPADKSAIAALVQQCLDAGGVDCGEWEAEIDARVAALYGL